MYDKIGVIGIGLLGGSFNPAHSGHINISTRAAEEFNLSKIWWLVSPHNPQKDINTLAPIDIRIEQAKKLCTNESQQDLIDVFDLETHLNTNYSIDLIKHIVTTNHTCDFLWLLGSDNFFRLHTWHKWEQLFKSIKICVFSRPTFTNSPLKSIAGTKFKNNNLETSRAKLIFSTPPPCWIYISTTSNNQSSSEIRNRQSGNWWNNQPYNM